MADTLLCLNSEWQGCESPVLESGSRRLAKALYGAKEFIDFGPSDCTELGTRHGIFALDCVAKRFRSVVKTLQHRKPKRIFTIGGTCGAEAAPVAYLNVKYHGLLGVVWFDAHSDLNMPETSPSGHFHGMVLRTLLGGGADELLCCIAKPLDPGRLVLAGVRDLDKPERSYVEDVGIRVIHDWSDSSTRFLIDTLGEAHVQHLYVHLDVDVFNPKGFGDSLFSVCGGPSLDEVGEAISALRNAFDIVGVGVVEYCGQMQDSASHLCRLLAESGVWPLHG